MQTFLERPWAGKGALSAWRWLQSLRSFAMAFANALSAPPCISHRERYTECIR